MLLQRLLHFVENLQINHEFFFFPEKARLIYFSLGLILLLLLFVIYGVTLARLATFFVSKFVGLILNIITCKVLSLAASI